MIIIKLFIGYLLSSLFIFILGVIAIKLSKGTEIEINDNYSELFDISFTPLVNLILLFLTFVMIVFSLILQIKNLIIKFL